jgi:hypothetical protein
MEIKEKVFTALSKASKPLRTGEIAELAGVEKKDAEKAVKVLNTEGKIFSPVRCFWQAR